LSGLDFNSKTDLTLNQKLNLNRNLNMDMKDWIWNFLMNCQKRIAESENYERRIFEEENPKKWNGWKFVE